MGDPRFGNVRCQGGRRTVAEYFAFTPQINLPFFTATLVTQGIVSKSGANLLYPALVVNAQQQGGIVFTLVGPNDYPSAAFAPVNNTTVGPIQIARAGNEPEDGFTGYPEFGGSGVARWGDYSGAAIDTDGVTYMATEYTPDIARTDAGELVHLYHSAPALAKLNQVEWPNSDAHPLARICKPHRWFESVLLFNNKTNGSADALRQKGK